MAEETQTQTQQATQAAPPAQATEAVVTDVPLAEKTAAEKDPSPGTKAPVVEEPVKPEVTVEEALEAEKPKPSEEETKATEEESVPQSVSFKEESNRVADLSDAQKKALEELKQLVQDALNKQEFTAPPTPPPPPPAKEEAGEKPAKVVKEEKPVAAAAVAVEEPAVVAEAAAVSEQPPHKPEIVKESKEEEKITPTAESPATTQSKVEEKITPTTEAPATTPPPPPPTAEAAEPVVVATEVVEKVTALDEDGAKTVEAIEESVVAVSAPAPAPPAASAEQVTPEKKPEEEAVPVPAETKEEAETPAPPPPPPEEVFIWGIPLLGDEQSDVILLKFLRARDFKVKEAFTMLKNTVRWRKEFGIEALLEEDLGNDLDKVVFMNGFDREGHPVCYNVYGEFQNRELYQKTFSDEEKRQKFLRWRIQFLEKSIRKLDFSPGGICTIVQVNDLKNSPGPGKWELRQATNQALHLLQDNYPEFVAKQVFVNVPWWYRAVNTMISPFLTQRTKSKFVFAGPAKSTDTLFKYIAPEQVPVKYGGLSKDGDHEFSTADPVSEIAVKPATKQTVAIPVSESCLLVWEIRVVGWDVTYGAEFVPSAEEAYTVIVQKARKMSSTDEPVICNNFKIGNAGKVVLTIDNFTSKKKKLLYRFKTKPHSD